MSTAFVPTGEQRAAIEHPMSALLVVAGAGTGKTSVMAARILHLVESGQVTPDQVLALTFTNKATAHLKQQVTAHLGVDADVTVSTYHAFGASLVASHSLELGLDPRTQVLNRAQAWQLLFAVFDEFRFQRRSTYVPSLVVDDALQLASRSADHLVTLDEVLADCDDVAAHGRWQRQRETAAKRRELCQVVAAYERRKREANLVDYGDQISLAVRLLREHPDLAAALREQHPVVLLDEYQDTNYAQRVLLQLVYPPGSPVTAVGDDMQSIYAFRGAHLGNILGFAHHFPPVTTKPLETNRRSGAELVTLANRIQGNVPDALDKTLAALPGAQPTSIECFLATDDAEEAAVIASDVASLGAPWSRHAVLCRKRKLMGAVVAALEDGEVPVEVSGAGGLLDRPEVVDLVSWLEVLADLSSSVALLRILQGPRYRIGWRDLAALARHSRALRSGEEERPDLVDALEDLGAVADLSAVARQRLTDFCQERRGLSALAGRLSVLDLAESITERTGLWGAAGERGRENLLRFFDLAARFEPVEGDPGLPAFVEYLRLLDETEEELAEAHASDRDAVRVMTVHQAKGLEFPNVWVPGLAGGAGRGGSIFPDDRLGENPLGQPAALPWWLRPEGEEMPHWRDAAREKDLVDHVRARRQAEEWRLFYVACTRAQRQLVCSAAHWYPGPAEPQGPSVFYEFVADQRDLVNERFRHEPPTTDPAVAAKQRRRAKVRRREHLEAAAEGEDAASPWRVEADQAPGPGGDQPAPGGPPKGAGRPVSVSGMVSYARCPLQHYWLAVRPLPRPPSTAARVGTEVHRWIEDRARGQGGLREPEPEHLDGPRPVRGEEAPPTASSFRAAFLASPYARLQPLRVEAPFRLVIDARLVRGRIDAVYERDGRVELVDFKTGMLPVTGDEGATLQLDLYALAAVEAWGLAADGVRTTYCYLRPDGTAHLDGHDWDAPRVDAVRRRVGRLLEDLAKERFEARPGAWCGRCDFLPFCPAGQAVTA